MCTNTLVYFAVPATAIQPARQSFGIGDFSHKNGKFMKHLISQTQVEFIFGIALYY
jgi:hypothetical protein